VTQTTFPQLLLKHAKQRPSAPALREKEYGIWQTMSWSELASMVEQVDHRLPIERLRLPRHTGG